MCTGTSPKADTARAINRDALSGLQEEKRGEDRKHTSTDGYTHADIHVFKQMAIHPSNHPKSANNKLPRTEADVNDGALIAVAADAYSAEQAADVQMLPMPIHNNCPVFNSLSKSILGSCPSPAPAAAVHLKPR